jgi:hypothetical protein
MVGWESRPTVIFYILLKFALYLVEYSWLELIKKAKKIQQNLIKILVILTKRKISAKEFSTKNPCKNKNHE